MVYKFYFLLNICIYIEKVFLGIYFWICICNLQMITCYFVKLIISFFFYLIDIKYSIRFFFYIIVLSCDQLCLFFYQFCQEFFWFFQNLFRVGYKQFEEYFFYGQFFLDVGVDYIEVFGQVLSRVWIFFLGFVVVVNRIRKRRMLLIICI